MIVGRWIGFTGNTWWDWLHLLLLPLLLAMFVVPALAPVVTARMKTIEEEQDENPGGDGETQAEAVPDGGDGATCP